MEEPKCDIKGCNNRAIIYYGTYKLCGNCMLKINNLNKEEQNKQIEKLNNAN